MGSWWGGGGGGGGVGRLRVAGGIRFNAVPDEVSRSLTAEINYSISLNNKICIFELFFVYILAWHRSPVTSTCNGRI